MDEPTPRPSANSSPDILGTILDNLDALVYVSDMQTYELLYMNAYGRALWGDPLGRKCWQTIQSGQTGPCAFCTNPRLLDAEGQPSGPYVWEFQNTVNGHWYQCRDQAIPWSDERLVRMEIATEITERKLMEQELTAAKQLAEALAHTDELTGLNNRRAFFNMGLQAIRQGFRAKAPTSLLTFDIDHFKHINDNFGHAVGDCVLAAISTTLVPLIREADILARIGGEEFAVLMPATDEQQAQRLAERLRAAIEALRLPVIEGSLRCTASFGLASSVDSSLDLDTLLSIADHAMYSAKQGGRNRIEGGSA
ncbi:MAG: diguanylate cyclase [Pseudomonas sp.]